MANPEPEPTGPLDALGSGSAAARTIRFLDRCRHQMELVEPAATTERDDVIAGAAALGAAIDRATRSAPKDHAPAWLPVLDSIDRLGPAASPADDPAPVGDLTADLVTLAPDLTWVPTHRATDGGTELALAPLDHMFDLGGTIVGLMYIGPDATYPLHSHPPQELYLTITGQGRWRYGGNEHHEAIGPNRTLYNHPGDLHTAEAGSLPVVALYVLW